MSNVKKEELYELLKSAYQHGVFGNIDLCDDICLELLNNFMNSKIESSKKIDSINIECSAKTDWHLNVNTLASTDFILEQWPNCVISSTTFSN